MNGAAQSAGRVTDMYVTDSLLAEPLVWTGVTIGWNSYPVGHSTESQSSEKEGDVHSGRGVTARRHGAQASWMQGPLGLMHAI